MIVLVYTQEVISTTFQKETIKNRFRNTGETRVYTRHFVFVWLTHYSLGRDSEPIRLLKTPRSLSVLYTNYIYLRLFRCFSL